MLQLTDDAMQICAATVKQLSIQANTKMLRLVGGEGDVSIVFDLPRGDDQILHHKGSAVLAVPEGVRPEVAGKTLDVDDHGRFLLLPGSLDS